MSWAEAQQYGLVFAATSLGIMGGGFINSRLQRLGRPAGYPLTIGLVARALFHMSLLAMTLAAGCRSPSSSHF